MALPPSTQIANAGKAAERDAKQHDALLREVDEAYRQDQLTRFAKEHGTKLFVAVVGGLALFGGWLLWSDHREGQREAASEEMIKALDQLQANNIDTAGQALNKLEKDGGPGAKAASMLTRAGLALQQNRSADAAKIYGDLAADGSLPQAYRDIATIRQVSIEYEKMKPADVVAKLKPLAQPGAPFFGSAGELLGAAYLDLGKTELAGQLFAQIAKDEGVPTSLRSRARQLAGLMGVDAIVDVDQTLKDLRRDGADQPPQQAQ